MKNKALLLCAGLPLLALSMPGCSDTRDYISSFGSATLYQPKSGDEGYYPSYLGEFSYGISNRYGENEAMISLDGVFSLLGNIYGSEISKNVTGQTVTYLLPNSIGTVTINATDDFVAFSDFDAFASGSGTMVNDAVQTSMNGNIEALSKSSYTTGGEMKFNLLDYEIPIYLEGDDALMPTEAANYLFLNPLGFFIAFNGSSFFLFSSYAQLIYNDGLSPFGQQYYGGALSSQSERGEYLAKLHGQESLFFLDHFYGFQDDERVNEGWGSYLKESYPAVYEGLYSTSPEESASAWDSIARVIIGDGHTGTYSVAYKNLGPFYNGGQHSASSDRSERSASLNSYYKQYTDLRKEKLGESAPYFQIEGDTAFIRFDSFVYAGITGGMGEQVYEEYATSDNYALFAYSFAKIKENGGIKDVVIDLTCNGGGVANSCMAALCFLTNEASYALYNPLTGSKNLWYIHGDANADGKIEDNESYAGQYDFYVLTSEYSFSCGNLFPSVCKTSGIKTIGAKSGGGACTVYASVTPDGQPFQISGLKRLSNDFDDPSNSIDDGISVDYSLSSEYWYDLSYIDSWLETI